MSGHATAGWRYGAQVRRARPDDLPRVRELLLRSLVDDHGYGYRADWHADIDDLQGCYLDRPGAQLLVAEQAGRVVGAVGLTPEPPRLPPELAGRYDGHRTSQLVRLVVDPLVRRQQVGSVLVHAQLESALSFTDLELVALHTNARNPASAGFWRSMGAVELLDESTLRPPDAQYLAIHFEYALRRRHRH